LVAANTALWLEGPNSSSVVYVLNACRLWRISLRTGKKMLDKGRSTS